MRAARAMAMFGLDPALDQARLRDLHARCARIAAHIDTTLHPGQLALVTGPSGSGKTAALGALAARLEARSAPVVLCRPGPQTPAPIIDRVGRTSREAMRLLAAAGLGEARLLARPEGHLSAGQQARFQLAVAMDCAARLARERAAPPTLIADEFASGLDDPTARSLAHSFAHWARAARVRAVVAGARADPAALAPDLTTHMDRAAFEAPPPPTALLPIHIEPGVIADYFALAHYHYAAARPGPVSLVLRAFDDASGALAGVLVVSRPTLNARWRRLAWPGRYEDLDLRARARLVNAELRVISRLIVDPRFRACAVATRLVRAYLADPLTDRTEAVSAMGVACPVFERAGMRPIRMPQRPQDGRLERFLARRSIAPEFLASAAAALWADEAAQRELRSWANASRRTRRLLEADPARLCRHAAQAILAEPVAYVAGPQ